jgi:cytochrome c556
MIRRLLLLSILAVTASAAVAQSASPERAIGYRQDVFGLIGWNFGAIGDMVRERKPWDASEATRRAERIAQLAKMTDEGFPPGSDTGATTDAKAEIWANLADFNAKMDDFRREADALAAVAKGGDQAAIKAQFAKTGGTCKACHDEYKAD